MSFRPHKTLYQNINDNDDDDDVRAEKTWRKLQAERTGRWYMLRWDTLT